MSFWLIFYHMGIQYVQQPKMLVIDDKDAEYKFLFKDY